MRTEYILLALVKEEDGVANYILTNLDLALGCVNEELYNFNNV